MTVVIHETHRPCVMCDCSELKRETTHGQCEQPGCGHAGSSHPRKPTEAGKRTMEAQRRYAGLAELAVTEMHRQDSLGYDISHDILEGLTHVLAVADTLIQVARAKAHGGELETARVLAVQCAATALKGVIQIDYLLGISDQLVAEGLPEIQEGDGH